MFIFLENLQNKTDDLITESKKIGLNININKTIAPTINSREPVKIKAEGTEIETVEDLRYVGNGKHIRSLDVHIRNVCNIKCSYTFPQGNQGLNTELTIGKNSQN